MKKSIIALAVASAVIAPSANAVTTLYGKVNQAISQIEGDAYTDLAAGASATRIHDLASRIGVKGSEDLGGGLSAIYNIEFGVNTNGLETTASGSKGFYSRDQFVGLKGGFGTFLIGKNNSPAKIFLAKVAYFFGPQHEPDDITGIGFKSGKRFDNTLAYISPNMGGFTFMAATVAGEEDDSASANADGLAEGVSLGLKYANGPFYAGLGYTTRSAELLNTTGDEEITGLALMYNPGSFQVGYMYETSKYGAALDAGDQDIHLLVAGYKFGNNHVKVKYGQGEIDKGATTTDVDSWGLWLEHNFSKRTKVYVAHSEREEDTAGYNTDTITSLGLMHNF